MIDVKYQMAFHESCGERYAHIYKLSKVPGFPPVGSDIDFGKVIGTVARVVYNDSTGSLWVRLEDSEWSEGEYISRLKAALASGFEVEK